MINALILKHHEYIDPNVWFPRYSPNEPSIIFVHNERGVFGWQRPHQPNSLCFGLGFNDWMAICRECGQLSKVDRGHLCNDHFGKKLEAALREMLDGTPTRR